MQFIFVGQAFRPASARLKPCPTRCNLFYAPSNNSSPLQELLHPLHVHGVQDILWPEPSLPCDPHSATSIPQSLLLMGIWIDGNFHSPLFGIFAQPPING